MEFDRKLHDKYELTNVLAHQMELTTSSKLIINLIVFMVKSVMVIAIMHAGKGQKI